MAAVPGSARHLVIGAGVHGLSTAWHLAQAGEEALVVDKDRVGAGASGIACGVVRNNYFQPAMSELMAACVEIWESDPEALHYHGSGYLALGPPAQEEDLAEVFERQQRIGYPVGAAHGRPRPVDAHMRGLFGDWRAEGLSVCLHEHVGGFAFNQESMDGLADKARAAGAQIAEGVEVTGLDSDGSGAVTRVQTSSGPIDVEQVVIAVGPWIAGLWEMLGLPDRIDVHRPDGGVDSDVPMWTYWYLQEGEVALPPIDARTPTTAREPPVLHVDSDLPAADDEGGLITEEPWGIYVKPDRDRSGRRPAADRGRSFEVDPTRPARVEPGFPDLWCAALSHCLARFEGCRASYVQVRSGGAGAFTADNFPVFDRMRPNVYVAADSNHGYKMIAVGREIARVLQGEHSSLLPPVPLRALRHGGPAPASRTAPIRGARSGERATSSSAAACTACPLPGGWPSAAPTCSCLEKEQGRRRGFGHRGRDRAQLLPLRRRHRADPPLGRDVRGRPRRVTAFARWAISRPCPEAQVEDLDRDLRAARRAGYELRAGDRRGQCREYLL